MNTKADIINGAFSQLRISGLTVDPTGSDLQLALETLENMLAEFDVNIGYNFEDEPDASSLTNVERKFWQALQTNLAVRLIPNFNKEVPQTLLNQANQSLSNLMSVTASFRNVNYPTRHPVGSGNQILNNRFNRFYLPTNEAPNKPSTVKQIVGNADNYFEDFEAFLNEGEDLLTYTLTVDEGLNLLNEALENPRINYQLQFEKESPSLRVIIVATTTTGRVSTKVRFFEVKKVPDANGN